MQRGNKTAARPLAHPLKIAFVGLKWKILSFLRISTKAMTQQFYDVMKWHKNSYAY